MIKRFLNWIIVVLTSITGYTIYNVVNVKNQAISDVNRSTELCGAKKIGNDYTFPNDDASRRAGGVEIARVFVSQSTGSTSIVGILITPHTEKFNLATNLPSENLWLPYTVMGRPLNKGGNESVL